jgi:hypothetical protein
MKCRLLRISALLLIGVANGASAQPSPQWLGVWKSQDGDVTMTISTSTIKFASVMPDENGKPEPREWTVVWRSPSDTARGELQGDFGYEKKRVSLPDIARRYEEALRAYRRDSTDFIISDPATSRQAIGAMSPGVYKVLWSDAGIDCDYDEYIIDGDKILDVDECKYRFIVRLFNRVR